MNILILGSGGREHAIAWKLARSSRTGRIFIAPGNGGTGATGTNLDINPEDFKEIKKAVLTNDIGMVLPGPEAPLVKGIHDFFLQDDILKRIPVIGPIKSAAMLEGSKDFAKAFMKKHNIPTSDYRSFNRSNISEARSFLKALEPPYVIKADGLAAGKGVVIVEDIKSAEGELHAMINGKFGSAGDKVVIEQFLKGIELSVFIVTDGKSYKLLPDAKDYKRIGEQDSGLNTGGMGSISPVPFADELFKKKIITRIIEPTIKGLREEGIHYKGFIFFGLINVNGDPYVIEYNCRLGDPESEAVIPRIESDLFNLLLGVAEENLDEKELVIDERYVSTVMLVSGGYPGHYEKGYKISGLEKTDECIVFHSGTRETNEGIVTSGGRVLAVSAWGRTLSEALSGSYRNIQNITFSDMYFRRDIGFDL